VTKEVAVYQTLVSKIIQLLINNSTITGGWN